MKSTRTVRILSVVMSFFIVIGVIAISKETILADTDTTTGLTYTVSGGTTTVTRFTAPSGFTGALAIPATLGGATVTTIAATALQNNKNLTSITIPSGVTSLGESNFNGCTALAVIKVDSANASYKSTDGVLYNKAGTTLICCPEGKSGNFTISSGAMYIEYKAFSGCTNLTGITIPSSVTYIRVYAFQSCTSLSTITIPSSVSYIEDYAFILCTNMTSINVDVANTSYKSVDGLLLSEDGTKLIYCPEGRTGSVTIPSGVTHIGNYAFSNCTNLSSITIPNGMKSIGYCAFSKCSSLSSITIPNSVTSLGTAAFNECTGLSSITIPSSVTILERNTFQACTKLNTITVDEANTMYKSIEGLLYSKDGTRLIFCPEGKSGIVTISNSVTSIETGAFHSCTRLTSVIIPDSITSIGDYSFYNCTNLTGITIPNYVVSIGNQAFQSCSSLTSINIPSSVASIGMWAFSSCSKLENAYFWGDAPTMGSDVFGHCFGGFSVHYLSTKTGYTNPWYTYKAETFSGDAELANGLAYTVKDGTATIIGFTAPPGFEGLLTIPETLGSVSVTGISNHVFSSCSSLTGIVIPGSVSTIESKAFLGCASLTSITVDTANTVYMSIEGSLYTKDGKTLLSCPQGKTGSITIPDGVTSIGSWALYECSGLTSIAFPNSITNIVVSIFSGCKNLASINVDASNPTYKSLQGILYTKDGTKLLACPEGKTGDVTIPNGVTSIAEYSFNNCTGLTSVTIPQGVPSILSQTFYGCTGMTNVTIPNSVASIEYAAFSGCTGLTSITIPQGVTTIGSNAFDGCTGLKSIAINGATRIGARSFMHCKNLTSITIPSSVTSIGDWAFYGCEKLSDAYFYGNAPTMGKEVFNYCASNFEVHYLSTSTGFMNPWYGYQAIPMQGVYYRTHVQDVGWQSYVINGAVSGTSGQSKRLEAINIKLEGITGGIEYRTHVQDIGWQDWVANDALSGTSGQSKRLEAIQIRLTGEAADTYDVYYRVHAQNVGWMDWAKNGESSGTAGFSYRLEAIEVKLVLKGGAAPGETAWRFIDKYEPVNAINYKTHVQDVGWQPYVSNGAVSGTSGESKRLEAIQIKLQNVAGGIEYRTHVQDIGWMDWVSNDTLSGTSAQSKRLEAIQIRLTGEAADKYDLYYCVHAENTGWLDWAKNGQSAGTSGFGYRLEAIQIVLVAKGGPAPGMTAKAFVQG